MDTTVDIQVYDSEKDASRSGAQNVMEVVPSTGNSLVRTASLFGGPDTGTLEIDAGPRGIAAHEFAHLLGVDDRYSGTYLSNTYEDQRGPYLNATPYDYGWAFGGLIKSHRAESRPIVMTGTYGPNPSGIWGRGSPQSHTSTSELRAPKFWWR